jgi:hypothetical protein
MTVRQLTITLTVLGAVITFMSNANAGPPLPEPTATAVARIPSPYLVPLLPYFQGNVVLPRVIDSALSGLTCPDIEINTMSLTGPATFTPAPPGSPPGTLGSWGFGTQPTKLSHATLIGDLASGTCSYKLHVPKGRQFTVSFDTAKCPASYASNISTTANSTAPLGPYLAGASRVYPLNITLTGVGCTPPPR